MQKGGLILFPVHVEQVPVFKQAFLLHLKGQKQSIFPTGAPVQLKQIVGFVIQLEQPVAQF